MKHPEIIVQIPAPCHESWHKMLPTEKGRFCHTCTKEVVDFSAKSDEEVIKYLTNNGNLCGRFHQSQLDRKLIADRKKRNHWLSYAASLLLPMALFSNEKPKKERNTVKTTQVDVSDYKSLNISSLQRKATTTHTIQKEQFTITGTITDDTGMPLPGATVMIKGSVIGKTTDFDGNYELNAKAGDVLVISYVGFKTKEVQVNKNNSIYNTILEPEDSLTIGIVCYFEPAGADEYGYVSKYDITSYPRAMTEKEVLARNERTRKYFKRQRERWLEKREKRRAKRAKRRAERKAKREASDQ
ncbi:carboxypeptidase-like regulatory domain-containing protein [Kordia algicida OT-1]|uniref:Uncharacterized protein n=1 Tax=Kordia algicida OT-1 TaxID=391587 RepID=A9DZJ6_9FLAO|nr:carboxypeptidase-like regulatory domain-containing protein [Kordia algicida]EDP95735.1 hypothetical protein KAOT1_05007 [Kordia algicida OT-1]